MKKTNLILIFTLSFTLTGIIAGTTEAFRKPFIDSETQALLDLKAKNPTDQGSLEMLNTLPLLQQRDREVDAWQNLPKEERDKIIAEKESSLEENMHLIKENEEELKINPPQPGPLRPGEIRGIHEEALSDSVDARAYKAFDIYWSAGRRLDEWNAPIFSAGYKFENPLQGLVEYHNGWERDFKYYPSPTATGPLKIVSEKDGVLTLVSVAGEFPKRDIAGENPEVMVKVPGGSTYLFDTKTLQFIR